MHSRKSLSKLWIAAAALACFAPGMQAQVVIAPSTPVVGSSNTVSAEPTVPRPSSKACTVSLFQNMEFADFNTKTYSYTPPADCPGPWAKVVFSADFTVTAGRQYDRTAQFYLGGANIYYGTTAEPRHTLSPSWHVERDVTDLSAIFRSAQPGTALLGNFVGTYNGVVYDGIIYANAQLTFYQANLHNPPAMVPDVVIGMPGNSGAATLNDSNSVYTQAVSLPTNVTSAYLDVIAQSQSNDEFWYTCVPNSVANELYSCGNTGFRETEITIDGMPAGVAPVYPWIYTGGIDPYLWEPIPGVQTLNFKPYRVDLSPFAALLADGNTHNVGIQVYNADSYFLTAANLLVYTDPFLKKVTGEVTSNTLAAEPSPSVTNQISKDSSGNVSGTITILSEHRYKITGNVTTWLGKKEMSVADNIDFTQTQTFDITSSIYEQDIVQTTNVHDVSYNWLAGVATNTVTNMQYPFSLSYKSGVNADGSQYATTQSSQKDNVDTSTDIGKWHYASRLSNGVSAIDTLNFNASGAFTGHTGRSGQNYIQHDTTGYCYSRGLSSVNSVLTKVVDQAYCSQ